MPNDNSWSTLDYLSYKWRGDLVIISQKSNQDEWVSALKKLAPEINIQIYPDDKKREDITFALVWQPPLGVFKHYPNLMCIASTGAGVDHILKDPDIPDDVLVTKIVNEKLTNDMIGYLLAAVMNYTRNFSEYSSLKKEGNWQPKPYAARSELKIGILGMGELGRAAAINFNNLGFNVHGWARSDKTIKGIKVFIGPGSFVKFLNESSILICLLPLTNETHNILNATTFKHLPAGAYIINVARGEHLVVEDLIEALDSGQLSGACLDVFREEPLAKDHPFWKHEKILITPHIASITNIEHVAPQITDNYLRLKNGQPLLNTISRSAGY